MRSAIFFLIKLVLSFFLVTSSQTLWAALPYIFSAHHPPDEPYMKIRLLGALELPSARVNGLLLAELSGLTWDADENLLYAISDRGILFHLLPTFSNEHLIDVKIKSAFRLNGPMGNKLNGVNSDSEGLDAINHRNGILGDTQLLVSFERNPRIVSYDNNGNMIADHVLPGNLVKGYKNSNKGLESVAFLNQFGIVTAAEMPVEPNEQTTLIYSLRGHHWQFLRYPAPNSSLVALEILPNGQVLTLERSFQSIWHPVLTVLRLTQPLSEFNSHTTTDIVARFNSYHGWRIDNFEGLTRYKDQRFFMISDDNGNTLQKTLLVHFEILHKK